jgi:hypothetical protein
MRQFRSNLQQRSNRGGSKVKATNASRATYNELQKKFGDKIITPSFLRLEKEVTGAVSNVDFSTLQNDGSMLSTERRLNLPDLFVVMGVGLFISKIASSSAANHAKAILRSFPNPNIFNGSGEADNLMALYNGFLSLRIGSDVIIDSMNCMDFYDVGQSQQGVGSSATSNIAIYRDQFDGNASGYVGLNPTINLDGSKKIQWSIQLPASTDLAGTSSVNTVSLILKGFLIQNGGSVSR